MERLSELAAVYIGRFPDLRYVRPNKCFKAIGDTVYGFEFLRIRGDVKAFFAGYSLWEEMKKSGPSGCLFFQEVHDSRGLQVPFQLQTIERVLARLLEGAELFARPPLAGDVLYSDFLSFVEKTQLGPLFRWFTWEKVKLLRLGLRTASFCGRIEDALGFRDQIVRCSDEFNSIATAVSFDYVFDGEKNWLELLEREIELGLSGNPLVESNRELLRKKGLVISEILTIPNRSSMLVNPFPDAPGTT